MLNSKTLKHLARGIFTSPEFKGVIGTVVKSDMPSQDGWNWLFYADDIATCKHCVGLYILDESWVVMKDDGKPVPKWLANIPYVP